MLRKGEITVFCACCFFFTLILFFVKTIQTSPKGMKTEIKVIMTFDS